MSPSKDEPAAPKPLPLYRVLESDGGHFENLALYEMVLRRCKTVVASDASDDPDFAYDNLGDAVRKIRIDFGSPVEFERVFIYPRSKGIGGAFCAVGRIRYSSRDMAGGLDADGKLKEAERLDGMLVYIKPVFHGGDEPVDVHHYARANERFPHESTVDQWFSEEQFESYRALGEYTIERVTDDKHVAHDKQLARKIKELPPLEVFREIARSRVGYYQDMADPHEARPAIKEVNEVLARAVSSFKESV